MKRIQRQRTKGWKMPPNTVYVGRPTKWGNPFPVPKYTPREAVSLYCIMASRLVQANFYPYTQEQLETLKNKNLACWCPLDQPCHADVLLELANKE